MVPLGFRSGRATVGDVQFGLEFAVEQMLPEP
jgi:hypothetical protein